ncbi:alanine aminotransferase 2-like [Genypterus blacodes]|uniref:alanine aminotransferase 2-like n=1 Tax=Genypterus blacodes TaxID=154954 RepID=UPI003F75FC2B
MASLQEEDPCERTIRETSQSERYNVCGPITQQLTQGLHHQTFSQVIDISTADPHRAGIKPTSFLRRVLAVCLCPELLRDTNLPVDVRQRALQLLQACAGGSVGAYSASSGLCHVRQSIAEFITRRDGGVHSYAENIFISSGSNRGLMIVLKLLAGGEGQPVSCVLTPVPCPHTLPPLLEGAGVTALPYDLREEGGWALDLDLLHRALRTTRERCTPRAIFISNPGNPTGHVQDRKSIEEVIHFAAAERLLLLVDEVYQDSVFGQDTEFVSYKKVLFDMGQEYSERVELVSFHSLSNAYTGECGLRAAYMEVVNMDPAVMTVIKILLDMDISAPIIGQLALDLMVHPPEPGDPSYDSYTQELLLCRATLTQNAKRACEVLNGLPGWSCQPAAGGVFLYPRLCVPPNLTQEAKEVLARLVSFHRRLMDRIPHPDGGVAKHGGL